MMSFLTLMVVCGTIHYTQSIAYDITNSTMNWQSILTNLKPGDIATIHHGIYVTAGSGYFQLTLNGLLTNPIIIQGAKNEPRPIIQCAQSGGDAQNIMNIQGSNFMVKGIAFTKGSRGVRLGPAGATTGECVYLGCVNDTCRIRDSLVDHNYCHDTLGSQGGSRAGFQVKTGSYNVTVRNNVCYNTVGPCIVVYDDYNRGRNLIDGNVAINAGTADLGIQCTSGATITNNIVINTYLAGIGVIQNSIDPAVNYIRNITISQNTVFMSQADACLRLNGLTNNGILISNNVFYCGNQKSITSNTDLTGYPISNNAVNGTVGATGIQSNGTFVVGNTIFSNVASKNFYPAKGSALISAGTNPQHLFPAYDFNGKLRSKTKPTVGSYEFSTPNNPGCPITNNFRCGSPTAVVPNYPI